MQCWLVCIDYQDLFEEFVEVEVLFIVVLQIGDVVLVGLVVFVICKVYVECLMQYYEGWDIKM